MLDMSADMNTALDGLQEVERKGGGGE